MENLQDDDEHVTVVYEDALRRAAPPTVRTIVNLSMHPLS